MITVGLSGADVANVEVKSTYGITVDHGRLASARRRWATLRGG